MNFCFEFLQELSIVWEAISNTRKRVSSYFQTPRSWLKTSRLRLVFSTHFSVFGNRMKHYSSCLIYYLKHLASFCPTSERLKLWNSTNTAIFPSNMSSTNVSNKPGNETILLETRLNNSYQFDCNENAGRVSLKLSFNEIIPSHWSEFTVHLVFCGRWPVRLFAQKNKKNMMVDSEFTRCMIWKITKKGYCRQKADAWKFMKPFTIDRL